MNLEDLAVSDEIADAMLTNDDAVTHARAQASGVARVRAHRTSSRSLATRIGGLASPRIGEEHRSACGGFPRRRVCSTRAKGAVLVRTGPRCGEVRGEIGGL